MAKIKVETDGFAAATKGDLRDVQRTTWAFAGKYWHRNYKAVKFTKGAIRRYGYTPRRGDPGSGRRFKGSYQEAKLLKKPFFDGSTAGLPIGEVKPLVWSGRSRSLAMAGKKVDATARSSGQGKVDIIIYAPALNYPGPNGRIKMRDEVTATIPQEIKQMSNVSAKKFEKSLLRIRRKKTIKG